MRASQYILEGIIGYIKVVIDILKPLAIIILCCALVSLAYGDFPKW